MLRLRVDLRTLLYEFLPFFLHRLEFLPAFSPSRACPSISRRPTPLDSFSIMFSHTRQHRVARTHVISLLNHVRLLPHSLGRVRRVLAHVLRDLHGTEMRTAHGAEVRGLCAFLRQCLVVEIARGFGIEREIELIFPAKFESGFARWRCRGIARRDGLWPDRRRARRSCRRSRHL